MLVGRRIRLKQTCIVTISALSIFKKSVFDAHNCMTTSTSKEEEKMSFLLKERAHEAKRIKNCDFFIGNQCFARQLPPRGPVRSPEEPKRHCAISTCMDRRIRTEEFTSQLGVDDAYICRNAGGRTTEDTIRSISAAIRLFAVDTIFVVLHTGCGLEAVTDIQYRHLLHENLGPATLDSKFKRPYDPRNSDKYRVADNIAFLSFKDLPRAVVDDVAKLRMHPLISPKVRIYGYFLDIESGELHEVKVASEIGRPTKRRNLTGRDYLAGYFNLVWKHGLKYDRQNQEEEEEESLFAPL